VIGERYLIDWGGVVVAYLAVREIGMGDGYFGPRELRFSLRFRTTGGEALGAIAVPSGRPIEEYLDDELRFLLSLVRDVGPRD
jgi:hypothetical protein